jgi:cell division septal protein FtsQ
MPKHNISYHQEVRSRKLFFYLKLIGSIVGVVCVASLLVYLIFFSPVFKIRGIQVTGGKDISQHALQRYFSNLLGTNIFFASVDSNHLHNRFPLIESASIAKDYPSTIAVTIREYPPFALFQNPTATFVFASNGVVIDKVSNTSGKYVLPLITSLDTDLSHVPLKQIGEYVAALEKDKKEFVTGFTFVAPYDIVATYDDGHNALVSLNKSITLQIQQMDEVQQYYGFKKCKSVDVRFTNVYCSPTLL